MKILMISAAFPPIRAGESDHALHLCQHLATRGLKVDVITTKGTSALGNSSITLHAIMQDWSWQELPRMARVMKRCAPDAILLIYSGWLYNHPMITFAPTLSNKLMPNVSFVTQFEIDQAANVDGVVFRIIRKGAKHLGGAVDVDWGFGTLLRDSDFIICLSERHQESLTQLLPGVKTKSIVVPPPPIMHLSPENNGETRRAGRENLGIKPEDFLLAFFGYLYPNKGIEELLQALEIVSRQRENVRLVIIGGGDDFQVEGSYSRDISKLATELGIGDLVIWTGKYGWDSDFASVCLRSADACVLPFNEGITLNRSSFAAAVTHGLPTVTIRGVHLEPQFVDKKNVLLCPPQNPEALAHAIITLIDRPEIGKQLRGGALELAQEWFSWDKAIERTLSALQSPK